MSGSGSKFNASSLPITTLALSIHSASMASQLAK